MKLIDANALADALFEKRRNYPQWVADTIGNMPVVDAVPVVMCKDCKKQGLYDCHITSLTGQTSSDDWFCADGERK